MASGLIGMLLVVAKYAMFFWLMVCIALLYMVGVLDSIWDEIVQFILRRKYEIEDVFGEVHRLALPYLDSFMYSLKAGRINRFVHGRILRSRHAECPICYEDRFVHRMIKLKRCDHEVCLSCLEGSIGAELSAGKTEFSCPMDEDCEPIRVSEVTKGIALNRRLRTRVEAMYVRTALRGMEAVFQCPSLNCKNAVYSQVPLNEDFFRVDGGNTTRLRARVVRFTRAKPWGNGNLFKQGEEGDMRKFKCGECGNSYCVLCSKVWQQDRLSHTAKSCAKYKQQREANGIPDPQLTLAKEFKRLLRDGIIRKCPRCGEAIVKNGGCSHMNCRNCGAHFCWRCNKLGCRGGCRYI